MTELEELIPEARSPVKRITNVAVESGSDALISDRPKRSKSRALVLSQDSFESDEFLMDIDEIEKRAPEISLGVSQEEKKVLPKGVLVVDSQPDSLAAVQVMNRPILLCSQEDIDTFIDRSLMRITERDLQIKDVQTPINTDKGKDVRLEASKRLHSSCMNFISLAMCTNYYFYAPRSSIESTPSFLSTYMQQNAMISHVISYELKLYADFVFISEEEQR
ncbi:hypothetical protein Cgig2_025985 [Carnegiea gigantea]|uniref:Uncharacterized protein n=1 Tax=Carnegiea gigantea TaxID=171969 RepID=A0A9Q1GNW5_9CARY|nr:hypothetical protein Cgig2_025985 [Carnegiea gigantea]